MLHSRAVSRSDVVLVVDAVGWLRRALEPGMRAEGLAIASATTAVGGLSASIARDPACVVIDFGLPDHDGLWLTAALREGDAPSAGVPIVLLADEPDRELLRRARDAGADLVLARGGPMAELRATVRALVAVHERLVPPGAQVGPAEEGRARSGKHRRVEGGSGSRVVRDEVVPGARPDPRAEPR